MIASVLPVLVRKLESLMHPVAAGFMADWLMTAGAMCSTARVYWEARGLT